MSADPRILLGFVVYLLAVAVLGYRAYRRTHDATDFILGRRQLPYWIAALSAGASDMSGWLLLGLPGLAYVATTESLFVALGLLAGTYLNWRFIARRLREQTEHYDDALTLPEYFERRFADRTRVLRTAAALCILVFFVFYTAAGFVAGGKLFAAAFGLPYAEAVTLGALLVVAYTAFGGFLAVAWTDAMQATLMFAALITVALLAISENALPAASAVSDLALADTVPALTIASALAWGLGYCGQPHILARFMAMRDGAAAVPARRLATAWTGFALIAAVAVGVAGHWVLEPSALADDRETVFIQLLGVLLHPAAAGICLAAILAAIMSTADSQLLVAAAALTHDLVPRATGARCVGLFWQRAAVCLICAIAWRLALAENAGVLALVATAWAGFGASLGPAVIMSLYAPNTSRLAVFAGMASGVIAVAIWETRDGGLFDLYSLLPGFSAGIAAMLVWNTVRGPDERLPVVTTDARPQPPPRRTQ